MAEVKYNASTFSLNEHESVLDCLLRNQQHIPYACKAGMCQACLVKAVNCEATEISKKWIKESWQAMGYTLACQWVPDSDVELSLPLIEEFSIAVNIKSIDFLNKRVMRLILEVEDKGSMFHYIPGQYLTLINSDGITRSYSIANNYEDDHLIELHIGQTSEGVFSGWLFHTASTGDKLHIRGPAGDCFYSSQEHDDFPILLAATGTGLAPLYGIIHDALKQNHQGPISLFHGGRTVDHLYYVSELMALQEDHSQFNYYPSVIEPVNAHKIKGLCEGKVEEVVQEHISDYDIGHTRVYLCGEPDFVYQLRKRIFLKGARSSFIFCDPFIERTVNLRNL